MTIGGLNFTGVTASNVSFGAGITINSITVSSDSQITANIAISTVASTGYRNISMTNEAGTGSLSNAFNVSAPSGGGGGGGGGGTTVDTTPPTVHSTSPASNSSGVAINIPVKATFSKALDASTITATTFTLIQTQGGTAVQGSVTCASNIATFTPSTNLVYDTDYTATLVSGAGGVKDLAGNPLAADYTWTFTTGADTTPPVVNSTSPAINATGVAINTPVTATFSKALDASTITTTTFVLKQTQGGTAVQGSVTCTNNKATFTPAGSLANNTSYTATITTGVTDAAGNHLATDYTWSFTTIAQSTSITVSLSAAPGTVSWNDTCDVNVNIANLTTFTAYQFNINYDPNILRVIGAEGGPQGVTPGQIGSTAIPLDYWVYAPSGTPGPIRAVGHLPGIQVASGSGYLVKIHFKVISDQSRSLIIAFTNMPDMENKLFDQNGNRIPAGSITWSGTTVNINAP